MKTLLFTLSTVIVLQSVSAQVKEGTIIYKRKIDVHRRMTDENMKAMVPRFDSSKVQLLFSGNESIFKKLPEENDIRDHAGDDGNRIVINMGGPDNETYKNFTTEKIIELRELGPKKYIVEDTLRKQNWKMNDETKTINGYNCKKATTKNRESKDVIAWYSEDILCPSGPEQYGGLPGAILELNVNDEEIVFSAIDIRTKDLDKTLVRAPTNGKKVSNKEFQKMIEEQFGPGAGSGGRMIRIIRD
ncbi:MAG: GLPGLI family protein [Bacteroidetes bacterium]|nr:GLPGLI family protein [Bacteroidota bacterium]